VLAAVRQSNDSTAVSLLRLTEHGCSGTARFEGCSSALTSRSHERAADNTSLSIVMHRGLTKNACLHKGEAIGSKRSIAAPSTLS